MVMSVVKTIDWMLTHKGLAVARIVNNDQNTVEIIKCTEDKKQYKDFKAFAEENNYVLIVGKDTKKENRLGYFR